MCLLKEIIEPTTDSIVISKVKNKNRKGYEKSRWPRDDEFNMCNGIPSYFSYFRRNNLLITMSGGTLPDTFATSYVGVQRLVV